MKNNKKIKQLSSDKAQVLLTFLTRTKNGDYAPIEESALQFVRIKEETELTTPCEEDYYYSFA